MKKVLGSLRRAVQDYDMIHDGDVIAVGVSGGKDSLLLLEALKIFQRFSPNKFKLMGIHIDMGFKDTDQAQVEALKAYLDNLDIEFHVVKTDLAQIIFEERKEASPCSLCSKMRRGALCNAAKDFGANKIALGHHADDVLETMLLSLTYEGRFSTFQPVSYMSRTDLTLIRPFVYLEEVDIVHEVKKREMPVVFNVCPMDKHTERQRMKNLVTSLNSEIHGVKDRMLSAIFHPERNNLWALRPDKKED